MIKQIPTPASDSKNTVELYGALAAGASAVLVLALLALIGLLYAPPPYATPGSLGSIPRTASEFLSVLHLPAVRPLPDTHFGMYFKSLLVIAWISYAVALIGLFKARRGVRTRRLIVLIGLVAVVFAVFFPPVLTNDAYAYVGYARLSVYYGHNPYIGPPITFLRARHDPIAAHMDWNIPTVYGPVWTLFSIGMVKLLSAGGIWWQVIAMKLLEAAALLLAALVGRAIAEHYAPGRGRLTLLAIGLNPILLIEGPGNGHNDLLLVAMILGAGLLHLKNRPFLAASVLGLTVGVKFIALVILPWILWECCRGKRLPCKARLIFGMTGLALLPSILGYAPFWRGAETFTALHQRAIWHATPAEAARSASMHQWLAQHCVWRTIIPAVLLLQAHWTEVAAFAALSIGLLLFRGKPGIWITAWGLMAVVFMFFTMGIPFAWYICWFWPVFLLRWDRWHLGLTVACWCLALVMESYYASAFTSIPPT